LEKLLQLRGCAGRIRKTYGECARRLSIVHLAFLLFVLSFGANQGLAGWWNPGWRFRVPLEFSAGQYDRIRKPAEVQINFTPLLAQMGAAGKFDPATIRVIEVGPSGETLVDTVAFQFDPDTNYNDSTNAAGTLVVLMNGTTAASSVRTYHVYFDFAGRGLAPAVVLPRVTFADGIWDEGQECFRVSNEAGTMYYHKVGAGFSSWVDKDGNDWVSYNPTPESIAAGSSRGIPNSCYPRGFFHPGSSGEAGSVTTLRHQGPLKVTIHSIQVNGYFECQWDIYPEYARLTMVKTDTAYWILYEGTPGGELELDVDFVVRSDGRKTFASERWEEDIPGEEWVYFGDPNVNRSLFLFHEEGDNVVDQYFGLTTVGPPLDGKMTVFGFGRQATRMYMYNTPQHFTYGIVDGTNYTPTASLIRSAGGLPSAALGQPEQLQMAPATLLSPPNGATQQSRSPRLTWRAYPLASGYRVQVARDTTFTLSVIATDVTVPDTAYTVTGLLANTRYYWRIAVVMPSYTLGFGQAWRFETVGALPNQVKLVSPPNGASVRRDSVVCRWNCLPGATRYALEWTQDSLFAYPDVDSLLTDTVAVLSVDLGTYYWRVRGKNEAGWGPYSQMRKFNGALTGISGLAPIPTEVGLLQNYPNPFNPSTKIQYVLPTGGRVKLHVFNTLGETVAQLIDEQQSAGGYSISFAPAASLPSGVYFYRLVANGQVWTRTMLLLR